MTVAKTGTAAGGGTMPLDGISLDSNPNASTIAYDTTSNRITSAGFQYDVAGNQTRTKAEDGTWVKYEYDSANRLWLVKRDSDGVMTQRFGYGASNARFQSLDAIANKWTLYAATGGNVLAEYIENTPNTPSWAKSYTYFGGNQLATITPNGGYTAEITEFNHPDRLGARLITNQAGGTSYEQTHLPFGRPLDAESGGNTAQRFTSYERSSITKLDYAINRTYDSKLGRFTQIDPIGMSAASLAAPQTLNMYSYCGNDPINYTDSSGLFWGFIKKLFKWIMVAVAVVVAIMTIVAAPFTIAGILGMISAASGATASVLGALGYNKAAMIFGLIAVATGFGSLIAGHIASTQAAAAAAARTPGGFSLAPAVEAAKSYKDAAMFGILSGVGAISNSFAKLEGRRRDIDTYWITALDDAWNVIKMIVSVRIFLAYLKRKGSSTKENSIP